MGCCVSYNNVFRNKYLNKYFTKTDLKNPAVFNPEEISSTIYLFHPWHFYYDAYKTAMLIKECAKLVCTHDELQSMIIREFRKDIGIDNPPILIVITRIDNTVIYIIHHINSNLEDRASNSYCRIEYSLNVSGGSTYQFKDWVEIQSYFDRVLC